MEISFTATVLKGDQMAIAVQAFHPGVAHYPLRAHGTQIAEGAVPRAYLQHHDYRQPLPY